MSSDSSGSAVSDANLLRIFLACFFSLDVPLRASMNITAPSDFFGKRPFPSALYRSSNPFLSVTFVFSACLEKIFTTLPLILPFPYRSIISFPCGIFIAFALSLSSISSFFSPSTVGFLSSAKKTSRDVVIGLILSCRFVICYLWSFWFWIW